MIKGGVLLNQIPGVTVPEMVELGQAAERLGYVRCWVADQGLDTRDVHVTLAAMAAKTRTIRLGPGITNPYLRHPAVSAASIASLDELSGGRAFHGIGAGGVDTLQPMGLRHKRPVAAMREMIEATRALYRGEAVNFKGETIQLEEARIDYARPDLEIYLAGRGPRMLSLGGELADGVMLGFIHKEMLQDYLDQIRAGAGVTGNKPRLFYYAMMITDEQMLEAVRASVFYLLSDSPPQVRERLGIGPAEMEAIRQVMVQKGPTEAGKLIKEEWIRPFALVGSVRECVAELAGLMRRFSLDEFILPILEIGTAGKLLAQVAEALPST